MIDRMGIRRLSPQQASPPTGAYSTLAVVPPGHELGWVSGQTGRRDDGSFAVGVAQQTVDAFCNLGKALDGIGLSPLGIVHLRTYLVGREGLAAFKESRDSSLGQWLGDDDPPASTLLIVSGLADPTALVEIEAVVARRSGDQLEPSL